MGSLVQERYRDAPTWYGSKADSAVADLGSCCGREKKRDKHPPLVFFFFFRSSSQGRHGQGWHRADMGQRFSFPMFLYDPCWELEPCTTSISSQVSASLGRRKKKKQVETGARTDHDKNRIPIHHGNYTKGHILSDHTCLCGGDEDPHSEPSFLGFSTVLWAMGVGSTYPSHFPQYTHL